MSKKCTITIISEEENNSMQVKLDNEGINPLLVVKGLTTAVTKFTDMAIEHYMESTTVSSEDGDPVKKLKSFQERMQAKKQGSASGRADVILNGLPRQIVDDIVSERERKKEGDKKTATETTEKAPAAEPGVSQSGSAPVNDQQTPA
jgi:hypothetical protein